MLQNTRKLWRRKESIHFFQGSTKIKMRFVEESQQQSLFLISVKPFLKFVERKARRNLCLGLLHINLILKGQLWQPVDHTLNHLTIVKRREDHGVNIAKNLATIKKHAGTFTARRLIGSHLIPNLIGKEEQIKSLYKMLLFQKHNYSAKNRFYAKIVQSATSAIQHKYQDSSLAKKDLDSGRTIGNARVCSGLYVIKTSNLPGQQPQKIGFEKNVVCFQFK